MLRAGEILDALRSGLAGALPAATLVVRNPPREVEPPAAGLVAIYDDPEPERESVLGLEQRVYDFVHTAAVEIAVAAEDPVVRGRRIDALMRAVAGWVEANRKLGGLCDDAELQAASPLHEEADEDGPVYARVSLPVAITYTSTSALG